MTKHASNSPVTFVTHKRFTVTPFLSAVLSRKLINIFILVVSRTTTTTTTTTTTNNNDNNNKKASTVQILPEFKLR